MFACFARFIIGLNAIAVIPSIWAPVTTFIVYAIKARVDGWDGLNIAQAFTSLALLDLVTTPSAKLLTIMPLWAQALGCFERLQHYLELPVREDRRSPGGRVLSSATNNDSSGLAIELLALTPQCIRAGYAVICSQMEVSLSIGGPTILKSVSLEVNSGSLILITGPTGSGKTTLLKTILGETHVLNGSMSVSSKSIAYCSQKPWITNTTIKEFIVGSDHDPAEIDESWYGTVIYACDLVKDIASMPDGDDTQLGSKGVSLSGGQKARLALARAVYSRRNIMLLDDVLSALDVNTEEAIAHRLLGPKGLLRKFGTTVLLVSHSQRAMAISDQIVTISKDGCVVHTRQSSPSHLKLDAVTKTPLDKSADVKVTE
ncbi:putative ABC transporter, partial [Aureobasidium melanogenum]